MRLTLLLRPDGRVDSVYSDALRDLDLGPQRIQRASVLEWDDTTQEWIAYRVTVTGDRGDVLAHGPDRKRVETMEREILESES